MRNKWKYIMVAASVAVAVIVAVFVGSIYKKNEIYHGNGIVYIVEDDKESKLAVFNSKGVYEEKIGNTSEIFWLASSVYEDETVSVDNNNNIYRFTDQGIESFENIETGIMAVLKVEESYILISETENSVCLSLYSKDFNAKLDRQEVPGTFQRCNVMGDFVYYSVSGGKEQFTGVYRYNIKENANEQLYYNYEESEEIYPILFRDKLYIAKNKLISENGNVNILKVYELQAEGELQEVLDIKEPLKKIIVIEDEIYSLSGVNSALISKMNLPDGNQEELFSLDNEAALGIYNFEGEIYVLTDRGVYELEGNQLLKRQEINALNLVNEFH